MVTTVNQDSLFSSPSTWLFFGKDGEKLSSLSIGYLTAICSKSSFDMSDLGQKTER